MPEFGRGTAPCAMIALASSLSDIGIYPFLVVDLEGGTETSWPGETSAVQVMVGVSPRGLLRRLGKAGRHLSHFPPRAPSTWPAIGMIGQVNPAVLHESISLRTGGDVCATGQGALVATSLGLRRDLPQVLELSRTRIVTLPNPFDVAGIGDAADRARAKQSLSPGSPFLVAIERLTLKRGFEHLRRYLGHLADRRGSTGPPGRGARASGTGGVHPPARRRGPAGSARFRSAARRVVRVCRRLRAFVLRREEGFGQAIVEEMALVTRR